MLPLALLDLCLCIVSAPRLACWRTGEHVAEMRHPLETILDPTKMEAESRRMSEPSRDQKKHLMELGRPCPPLQSEAT